MPEERKLVTILFADVTGWTALSESLDPEDVRALASRFYQHARRVVEEHGGTLEKFIGDALMAVFGLPHVHGNDPERALASALALRAAVMEDPLLAPHFLLHAGVNTGEVATAYPAADPATADSLVTGDAVNTASRLYDAAEPSEILAGERTHAAARGFRFGESRLLTAKNKRLPLRAYPLLGPGEEHVLSRPPLMGRKLDLAQLALLRQRALDEQRPQLVSIVAPAGTGKTRLLEEFLATLDAAEGWQVATARCLPYGQTLTYWPLRGLLEEALGEPATKLSSERVGAALTQGGRPPEEARERAVAILATLGIETEGAAEREVIFPAWRAFLEALARQAPRIVVFEDLHWASESLLDLVEHVMQPRTRAALLIIATSRPELLDRRPAWGGGRSAYTALALEPLSERQTRHLVEGLAEGLPASASQQIVERSGGNPFFAIELTRAAAERESRAANDDLAGAPLPDTVHEALLARLDQLAPRERRVLQAASVAGRTFRPATLRALVDEPPTEATEATEAVVGALDALLARDLIALDATEADAYVFRHILIRDVAYGTLSRSERIRLHAAVAAWLEHVAAGHTDEFAELIAYHYREAAQLARQSAVPLALPFDLGVAVRSLERAGEVAAQIGAWVEASRHLQAAIALAPTEEHLRLYEKVGDGVASGERALEAYNAALRLWRDEGQMADPLVGARLLRKVLIVHTRWESALLSRPAENELEALLTEARRLAAAAGNEDERWRVRMVDLFWTTWRGFLTPEEAAENRALAAEAAAYFEGRGLWQAASEALDGYFSVLLQVGAFHAAAAVSQRRLALPGLSHVERLDARACIAWACCDAGDYAGCIDVARQRADFTTSGLSPALRANTARFSVWAAFLSGRWSELPELVAEVEGAWAAIGPPAAQWLGRPLFGALTVALARENHATADRLYSILDRLTGPDPHDAQSALLAAYRSGDVHVLDDVTLTTRTPGTGAGIVHSTLVLMFLNERATPPQPSVLSVARHSASKIPADCLVRTLAIAEALAADDDAQLAGAIEDADAHDLVPHAARMQIVLAQRLGDRAPLDRARPVLERLGDHQFLRRLEEVQAALQ
jgi:class 3 adenylate cyclase